MVGMKSHPFMLAVALVAAQCSGTPSNPVSPQYPCGTRAHACSVSPLSCCWNGEVCGGEFLSCPVGMCCYDGESLGKNPDAGTQQPQWR